MMREREIPEILAGPNQVRKFGGRVGHSPTRIAYWNSLTYFGWAAARCKMTSKAKIVVCVPRMESEPFSSVVSEFYAIRHKKS